MQYKFALVSGGRIEYITDDDMPISLSDFRPAGTPGKLVLKCMYIFIYKQKQID